MNENRDILEEIESSLWLNSEVEKNILEFEEIKNIEIDFSQYEKTKEIKYSYETIVKEEKKWNNIISWVIFFTKYLTTTAAIFLVLLVTTNYSAYINVAKSYIFKEQFETTKAWILSSVEASQIRTRVVENVLEENENTNNSSSISQYKKDLEERKIDINIEITPFDNRVIVPKIGKNIPLLEVQNRNISWESELNDIFMKELENWIIRYPGSAKPWEIGNSFIFWHSSNFPWMKWDYNDVFANLDNVRYWDEVIVYYWQKKYTYRIKEKRVIRPGDVSILERNKDKSEVTLMTCWPIWTTLNRLIVVWELVENED